MPYGRAAVDQGHQCYQHGDDEATHLYSERGKERGRRDQLLQSDKCDSPSNYIAVAEQAHGLHLS